jgi:hypothetical protein
VSPTQRTLKHYRALGYTCGIVEFWNPHVKQRKDLFGFADICAFNDDEVLLIQATSGSNTSARKAKILDSQSAARWIDGPNRRIIVIGWRQLVARKKDGTKAKRKVWTPKIEEIGITDFLKSYREE